MFRCPNALQWPAQATGGAPGTGVIYYPSDYGFNINEGTGVAKNGAGTNGTVAAWFQNNPSYGFNETVTLAKIQSPAKFLILGDAQRGDGTVVRGSLIPQYSTVAN